MMILRMKVMVLLLLMSFASVTAFAQRIELRGAPLSVSLVDSQNLGGPIYLAVVIWDGEKKVLISGAVRDRQQASEIEAMLRAEIEDGDEEQIIIGCTRRPGISQGGKARTPGPRHDSMNSLQVDGHLWQGNIFMPN